MIAWMAGESFINRRRRLIGRYARTVAGNPMRVAAAGIVVTLLCCLGFLRFSIDSGQSLLVGSQSNSAKTYSQFTDTFGTDPIAVLFTANNGQAFELDKNLQRLAAAEDDIGEFPGVASVMGPGTVLRDAHFKEQAEIGTIGAEYPAFAAAQFADASYQKDGDARKAQQIYTTAQQSLFACLVNATVVAEQAAETARDAYKPKAGDRVVVSREDAATNAAINALLHIPAQCSGDSTSLPPLFSEYVTGTATSASTQSQAASVLGTLVADFGTCDPNISAAAKLKGSCQVFDEHLLLELKGNGCPLVDSKTGACPPRDLWAPILPKPPASGNISYALVLVRLTPAAAKDRSQVDAIKQKISDDFRTGITKNDPYIRTLNSEAAKVQKTNPRLAGEYTARATTYLSLKALSPTECGAVKVSHCVDKPVSMLITGAAPLAFAVADSVQNSLLWILPVALFMMAVLLAAIFRVRGRFWPLFAAALATAATTGLALLFGASLNPAVLAGVPILVGLGVDYAVQLIARFDADAKPDEDLGETVNQVVSSTGSATAIAAGATITALLVLALVSGIDTGPLVAVPLIADFALIVAGGTLLAWLAAITVALPIVAARHEPAASASGEVTVAREWRVRSNGTGSLLVIVSAISMLGWILLALGRVPVQTDLQTLLAGNVDEVQKLNQVAGATGANSEIDIYLRGDVGGVSDDGKAPSLPFGSPTVYWECQTADRLHPVYGSLVPYAFGPTDLLIGSSHDKSRCLETAPSPAATPRATPSAAAMHQVTHLTAYHKQTSASPAPAPSSQPSSGQPAPARPTPAPIQQSRFICQLRSMPAMSSLLVASMIPVGQPAGPIKDPNSVMQPCPPTLPGGTLPDKTPVRLTSGRIAVAVSPHGVADIARLTDSIDQTAATAPKTLTVAPTGLSVLAARSYDTISGRGFFFNVTPLIALLGILLLIYARNPRRAILAVLPTALAAGWVPLVTIALGFLPGTTGANLGSFNPLSAVMGALVIALATEFGIVLLSRFYEELGVDDDVDAAARRALARTGRPIIVSAATLMGGFAVLAVSAVLPGGLPLLGAFGLSVVIDLALAVAAVFWVMLPVAVAWERAGQRRAALDIQAAGELAVQPKRRTISGVQGQAVAQRQAKTRAKARPSSLAGAVSQPAVEQPKPKPVSKRATAKPASKRVTTKPESKTTPTKRASKRTTPKSTSGPPAPESDAAPKRASRKPRSTKPVEPPPDGAE